VRTRHDELPVIGFAVEARGADLPDGALFLFWLDPKYRRTCGVKEGGRRSTAATTCSAKSTTTCSAQQTDRGVESRGCGKLGRAEIKEIAHRSVLADYELSARGFEACRQKTELPGCGNQKYLQRNAATKRFLLLFPLRKPTSKGDRALGPTQQDPS